MTRLSDDRLASALRSEAARHRPDRDAMLDRIAATAMWDTRRDGVTRRGPRVRLAAVVAVVATIFGGVGVGTWVLAGGDKAAPAPAAAPVTVSPGPADLAPSAPATPTTAATATTAATTKPRPSRTTPSASPTVKPSPVPTKGQQGNTRVEQGPLWSDGSVDPDSGDTQGESVVTLKTTAELTSLEVVIRVARTDGLVSRGGTKQTPGASVTTRVDEEPGAFLYRFTLSPADTLAPGTYTFTARYTHPPGGRDAGGDTYEATAGTSSTALNVYGDFY